MRSWLLITCLLFSQLVFAQSNENGVPSSTIDAIKNDIWIPFMESYRDLDTKKLKGIHTKDIFRVTIDQNLVETGEAYLENFASFIEGFKARGGGLGIAFSIMSTAIDESGKLAYQTGYYRISTKRDDNDTLAVRGYGLFNVALRLESGKWKISLDSDKRVNIDAEEFKSSGILYDLP